MLVEVNVKVTREIAGKDKKFSEVYVVPNCEFFSEAELKTTQLLEEEVKSHLTSSFEIKSLKCSTLKEICEQYYNEQVPTNTYIATVRDYGLTEEKANKYNMLLWADNHTQAVQRVNEIMQQGYDMHIESIKEVNYVYVKNYS